MEQIMLYKDSIAIYLSAIAFSSILAKIYDALRFHLSKIKKIMWYGLISLPFSLVIGFRRYDVGWDTSTYARMFQNADYSKSLEYVYVFLVKMIAHFTDYDNYTAFFVFFAFMTIFMYLYAIEAYKENSKITLSLFLYEMFLGLNMADQMRQMLAMSFFMCALAEFFKCRKKSFVIFLLIACGIHTSAAVALIIFLPVYFLRLYKTNLFDVGIKIRSYTNLIIFLVLAFLVIILGDKVILTLIFSLLPSHYDYLITRLQVSTVGAGYLLDISLTLGMVLLFAHQKKTKQENILYAYACLSFVFRFLGYYSFFAARLNHYSILTETIILPHLIQNQKMKKWIIVAIGIMYLCVYYFYLNVKGNLPYYPFWQK